MERGASRLDAGRLPPETSGKTSWAGLGPQELGRRSRRAEE